MSINFNIVESKLTENSDDHYGKVAITASADLDAIVDQMILQGSTITKSDIYAVLEESIKATENLLLHGMRVNFGGLAQLYPRIKGKFTGPLDSFNESRHKLDVGATPGKRVRNALRQNGRVQQKETVVPGPNILQVFDFVSDEINGPLTRGSICSIRGNRLKFDPDSTDEGIYLIRTSDNSEVRISNIFKNMPKELVLTVPDSLVAEESYFLEVRCRMKDSADLRNYRFNGSFTVA